MNRRLYLFKHGLHINVSLPVGGDPLLCQLEADGICLGVPVLVLSQGRHDQVLEGCPRVRVVPLLPRVEGRGGNTAGWVKSQWGV